MIIEVHPEELLDREARGELTAREQALLDAHLARCAPCRLERRLRADFELEQARPMPSSDLTDVIAGALRACEIPPVANAASASSAAPAVPARSRLGRRVAMLLVACGVMSLGIGYAGAQLGLGEGSFVALLERVGVRVAARPRARPATAVAPKRADTASDSRAAVAPETSVLPAPALAPVAEVPFVPPAPVATRHPRRHAARSAPVATPAASTLSRSRVALPSAPPRVEAPVASAPVASSGLVNTGTEAAATESNTTSVTLPAPTPAPESAGRLFERASRARHRGASVEASALYDELRARFPDSPEARLSIAVSARMLLDQGELRAALAGFDAYLAGSDRALHEEAMVGRVRALERLGRERDAQNAAEALLRAHPRSAFRPQAEALIAGVESD
jgi:hypothetical protein